MTQEIKEEATAVVVSDDPVVAAIGQMELLDGGVREMMRWVKKRRPECVPEEMTQGREDSWMALFPHSGVYAEPRADGSELLSDNELLVELAGRKCYNSFGAKAGRKTNREYIENTQAGSIPHASIMYHAKMTFFVAGVSRRVSHELIRHYVGADRDEEGSPSQESTRYVEHTGHYIAHPSILDSKVELAYFESFCEANYADYLAYIRRMMLEYENKFGSEPKGMARKRILEAASAFLSHSVETSFLWTTNPIALAKMIRERQHEAADREWQRLAAIWKEEALNHWPNLFVQEWMK